MADELNEEQRWEVAKLDWARANHSGDVMRTLLFSASAGAIAFILQRQSDKVGPHVFSVLFFGVAAGLVFVSWDKQKRKATRRFREFKSAQSEDFAEPGKKGFRWDFWKGDFWRDNTNIDRFTAICIAVGAGLEIIFRFARV